MHNDISKVSAESKRRYDDSNEITDRLMIHYITSIFILYISCCLCYI
jgi:hypothetical protein